MKRTLEEKLASRTFLGKRKSTSHHDEEEGEQEVRPPPKEFKSLMKTTPEDLIPTKQQQSKPKTKKSKKQKKKVKKEAKPEVSEETVEQDEEFLAQLGESKSKTTKKKEDLLNNFYNFELETPTDFEKMDIVKI